MSICADAIMQQLIRTWVGALALALGAFLLLVPRLVKLAWRSAGALPPSYRRRLGASLAAVPAFAAAMVGALCILKLTGWGKSTRTPAAAAVWLLAFAAAVPLCRALLCRDLPNGPRHVRASLWVPAAVAVLALAGGFVAVGRIGILSGAYLEGEVALRELAVSLERHRAELGAYPSDLDELPEASGSTGTVYYIPPPPDSGEDLVWAWRVIDDPLGSAVAVLETSGRVRWVRPRAFSELLERTLQSMPAPRADRRPPPPEQTSRGLRGPATRPRRRTASHPMAPAPSTRPAARPRTRPAPANP